MTKPKLANIKNMTRLEIFAVVFILFQLAFMLFRFYHAYVLGEIWPVANPLYRPDVRFLDFYEINKAVYGLNPYISRATNYPPLVLIIALPFAYVTDYTRYDSFGALLGFADEHIKASVLAFVSVFYACILVGTLLAVILKKRKKSFHDFSTAFILFGLLAVSTPLLFAIDRGNYVLFTIVFLVFWAVFEEEKPDTIWGAVFLGLAAATKIYPIYMLMIYVIGRKWKKLIAAIVAGLVSTLVPMCFFQGGFYDNCRFFYHQVIDFNEGPYRLHYNVGLTSMVGYIYRMFDLRPDDGVIKIIWLVSGVVLTLAVAFIFIFEKTMWKKILLVVSLMVFLTPNSGLYNSCYLFAPILIMVLGDSEFTKKDIPYLIFTALLMVPFAYSHLPNVEYNGFYNDMNPGVLIDGLLYAVLILYYIGMSIPDVIRRLSSNARKQPA